MNLLFLSRGGIHFPPLESARTKNRPGTICVFNNILSRERQPGEASPWLMGCDWQGRQGDACGHFAKARLGITCACLSEMLARHAHTHTHTHTHVHVYACKHTSMNSHTYARIPSCHRHTQIGTHTHTIHTHKAF